MIILLCGKKQVGKDTVANYLVKNYSFVKYSFADPMKKACKEIFMLDDDQLWGDKKEVIDDRLGITPRKLLQVFGTELFQYEIYNHIPELMNEILVRTLWVQRFKWWYEDHKDENIVISDGRFLHELEGIKKLNGLSILIHRKQIEYYNNSTHKSEKEIDKITSKTDYVIYNDNDFFDLYKQIDNIMFNITTKNEKL